MEVKNHAGELLLMDVKQFKNRFVHGMIEPELFYLHCKLNNFNKLNQMSIIVNTKLNDLTGHPDTYAIAYHGYERYMYLDIYRSLINPELDYPLVKYGEYTSKLYKHIGSSAYGGGDDYYHILNENGEIVGEYVSIKTWYSQDANFQMIIDSQNFYANEIMLCSAMVVAGRAVDPYGCREHRGGLINSYMNCNPHVYIDINNKGKNCYLRDIYPKISDEISNLNITFGRINWWVYIDINNMVVKSRYSLMNDNNSNELNLSWIEKFNLAKSTDKILFSYK